MNDTEYSEQTDKANGWRIKQIDKAQSWLSKERDKLDILKCPQNRDLLQILNTDLFNRYKAICNSVDEQWMAMIKAIEVGNG